MMDMPHVIVEVLDLFKMKTCLIYGQNGLDLDVALNLQVFYKLLGFKSFFSSKLYDADLLVVVRAIDASVDLLPYSYQLIHIFDYAGWDFDIFIHSIDYSKSFIFCTSETKMQQIIRRTNFPSSQIYKAFPPVEVSLWVGNKAKKTSYDLVHIGNYKSSAEGDPIKARFDKIIQLLTINVWGIGWNGIAKKTLYHGKLGLFNVSSIYSQSKFALGLMYPFQRIVTYSGRFWHAPLNGCSVLSEPGVYTKEMPGIIETDYSLSDVEVKINKDIDRDKLREDAEKYWEKQYKLTLYYVKSTLYLLNSKKFNIKKYVIWIYLSINNLLRKIYQKHSLFKINSNK